MYAISCCSHPSLILKRVITSSWSSRVTTASLPAPLTFFLPLSSFAAHIWLRILSFISIPNAFQRASHWTTEMNASANRRFLSRSQKRVHERERNFWAGILTFEEASRRSISSSRFLCSSICFPASASSSRTCPTFRLGSCSGSKASAMASCFFSFISRARSAPEARRSISVQWGARRWQRQDQWCGEKVETGSRRFRTTDWSFSVSLQCFCILFCMRSALATAWQPRACPLANPDNNR